jgi:hypothetical protein
MGPGYPVCVTDVPKVDEERSSAPGVFQIFANSRQRNSTSPTLAALLTHECKSRVSGSRRERRTHRLNRDRRALREVIVQLAVPSFRVRGRVGPDPPACSSRPSSEPPPAFRNI